MHLTEKILAELKLRPGETERLIGDAAMTGLRLRLRQSSKGVTRTWVYKYSIGGVVRSITFDAAGHSLAAARKRAGELQAAVRLGGDPAQKRDAGRLQAEQTMGAALRTYLPMKRETTRARTFGELDRHLTRYLQPLHRLPLATIVTPTISARLAAIAHANGITTSDNVRRSLHAFFVWAMRQGLVSSNPVAGVERRRLKSRDRVLTADEIRIVWEATGGDDDYSAIVRTLLLTGARLTEIGQLTWSEVYSDRIILPPQRVKNGRMFTLPITPQVDAILVHRRGSGREFVFGRNEDGGFVGWGGSKASIDARIKAAGHELPGWTHHDLRRTMATGLSELGIGPHIVEAALNHVSGFRRGVAGVYNHATYESQIRHALLTWETHVMSIVKGRVAGDRIVPLRRA
jgi:integrase